MATPTQFLVDPTTDYARAVVAGTILAGRLVRLACQRHLTDLETGHERGLRFDVKAAARVFRFFAELRLPVGGALDGKAFELEPFQKFIVGCLFGWKKADRFRRFRTAYVEQGKGNGKSPLAGGIGLYGLVADGEAAAEVYSAATKKEQATILFRDAKRMVEASPVLRSRLKVDIGNIAYLKKDAFFRPVSAEKRGLDGPRPHIGLIDEVHEHPDDVVIDKISGGVKNRNQSLIFEITNSGYDKASICWRHHEYSAQILEGYIENDSWFAYVCQLDPCEACHEEGHTAPVDGCEHCDDWQNEAVWLKANPGLDTILPRSYVRDQVRVAKAMPAKASWVKRLNFCLWTEAAVHAIPMVKWDRCKRPIDLAALAKKPCFGALDIGATSDFTAFALLFPDDDSESFEIPSDPKDPESPPRKAFRRSYTCTVYFWLPEQPVQRPERIQQMIDLWIKLKHIRVTPGEVVYYAQVFEDIKAIVEPFGLQKIVIDYGFQGVPIAQDLQRHFGEEMIEVMRQGIISMAPPFRELIELVIQGRFHHDGNPVLRWMAANTQAETRGGLTKPSKDHSQEKIDGITACTMGLAPAMVWAGDTADWYTPGSLRN